jgi:PhzF family phenazine biosynthesis protein
VSVFPLYHVDSFTAEPFRGNPAGVVLLETARDESWMRAVARETNLSETSFLHPEEEAWRLRWFTPTIEVPLCGHGTLAAAHVLWESGQLAASREARFRTASGELVARRVSGWVEMDFPAFPDTTKGVPENVRAAVGLPVRNAVTVSREALGEPTCLVELGSEREVRELRPDLSSLRVPGAPGLLVTARSETAGADFVSRYFVPSAGIDEDPVTGSAHCCLAPYWAERLGRQELIGYQASARGGYVRVRLEGRRVALGGQAVTISRGELLA